MLRSGFQREAVVCFGLSHLGDLHFGQTVGRSPLRGNHSCPQRHRHPSSLAMPIGFASFAIRQYLSYLPILDTTGIDKYPHLDIQVVYTNGRIRDDGRTASTGTPNREHGQDHQTRSRYMDRAIAIGQRALRRYYLEGGKF